MDRFEQSVEQTGVAALSRFGFRECLQSKSERFTQQEVKLLMQMVRETDNGSVRARAWLQHDPDEL